MKALLLKDVFTLLKQMKLFFLMVVVLAMVPGFSGSGFAIVYAALLPITALAYDERAKWDKLAVMMPFSPKELVVSKYLLGYLSVGAAVILCAAAQYLMQLFFDSTVGLKLFCELAVVASVALLLMSLNLPLVFKLGVEKGRMMFLVLTVAVVISGVSYGEKYISSLPEVGISVLGFTIRIFLAAVIFSLASMAIAVRMYKKAEK